MFRATHQSTDIHKVNFRKTKRKILSALEHESYDQITTYLKEYSPETIQDFFATEGYGILFYLINKENILPFQFTIENVSTEIIKSILATDNYSLLRGFIYAEENAELRQQSTMQTRQNRIEKFKLFFAIDADNTQKLLSEHFGVSDYLYHSLKEDYQVAIQEFMAHKKAAAKKSKRPRI